MGPGPGPYARGAGGAAPRWYSTFCSFYGITPGKLTSVLIYIDDYDDDGDDDGDGDDDDDDADDDDDDDDEEDDDDDDDNDRCHMFEASKKS